MNSSSNSTRSDARGDGEPAIDSRSDPVGAAVGAESTGTLGTRTLGMMAKYWEIGEVKTRLGADIGNDTAARIHQLFVRHLSEQLTDVADQRVAVVAPKSRIDRFAASIPRTWQTCQQTTGDLGERMRAWFESTLGVVHQPDKAGHTNAQHQHPIERTQSGRAILIGADCPSISPKEIDQAFETLAGHDVVLGPAVDGGYYLIGLRGPWRAAMTALFDDIPWSTEQVLLITRQRIDREGLSCSLLPIKEDVDTIAELSRLLASLRGTATRRSSSCELADAIEELL